MNLHKLYDDFEAELKFEKESEISQAHDYVSKDLGYD